MPTIGLASEVLNCVAWQAIKDALWAFATINYLPSTTFLEQCATHCLRQLHAFNPQNMANVAWAYAKFGVEPNELFNALAQDVRSSCLGKANLYFTAIKMACKLPHSPFLAFAPLDVMRRANWSQKMLTASPIYL